MRFRPGRLDDLAWCQELLERDGGLPMDGRTRETLPRLWERLLETNAVAGFAMFENDESEEDDRRCGFAMSAFAREDFAREIQSRPVPYVTAVIAEREDRGEPALLTLDEVRAANSDRGLDLVVLHTAFRHLSLDHPETRRMIPIAGHSFFFAHAGYQLLSIFGEFYGEQLAMFMKAGGYRVMADFSSDPALSSLARRPYLVRLGREDVALAPMNQTSLQIFHVERPRFFFTAAEQRILLHALLGWSDRQIGEELDLSIETVRSAWDSVYTRVSRVTPRLLGEAPAPPPTTTKASPQRGAEKRRLLLDYLRQHMEELRPVVRPR